jgi:sensor histidine kinase YesM
VADDGVGPRGRAAEPSRDGIGLGNTKARLEHLYGKAHEFSARGGSDGGFIVDIVIPYRPRSESPSA